MGLTTHNSYSAALQRIALRAEVVDQAQDWPRENLEDLASAGAMGWAVPVSHGGTGMPAVELHERYEMLAAACLTTALILTQRDSAVGFLLGAEPTQLVEELLRGLGAGQIFATIGIAQLTTSRQHLPPQVTATQNLDGTFTIRGTIPWATGAQFAQRVIVGAALGDGQQILAALNTARAGVEIGPPLRLAALAASFTAEITLRNVVVPAEDILRGPCENALAGREAVRGFALPTCILPLGVARGALEMAARLAAERSARSQEAVTALREEFELLRGQIYAAGTSPQQYPMAELSPRLRAQANMLASRTTLTALELAKGTGFLLESPAQRRAREALFFFVWSSLMSVMDQTLGLLGGN